MTGKSPKAIVIHCIDYRFVAETAAFLRRLRYAGRYDDVGVAGAAKNFVDPYDRRDPEFLYRQIRLSIKLHKITDVVVINHSDCGAYGGTYPFRTAREEYERHSKDLRRASEMVRHRFLDDRLTVIPVFARRKADGSVDFVRVREEKTARAR